MYPLVRPAGPVGAGASLLRGAADLLSGSGDLLPCIQGDNR